MIAFERRVRETPSGRHIATPPAKRGERSWKGQLRFARHTSVRASTALPLRHWKTKAYAWTAR